MILLLLFFFLFFSHSRKKIIASFAEFSRDAIERRRSLAIFAYGFFHECIMRVLRKGSPSFINTIAIQIQLSSMYIPHFS